MSCEYSLEKCDNKDESDCLRCKREKAEARYWIRWARYNGSSSWYAQKMKLIRIRGEDKVKSLVRNMEKLRNGV